MMNLSESLTAVAQENPQKVAFYFEDEPTTYGELDAQVTKFASGLAKIGFTEGDHIAILLGNSPQFVISLYGIMRLGATAIPINPTYTPEEISYMLNNSDAIAVITLDQLAPSFEKMEKSLPKMEQLIVCQTNPIELQPKMKTFTDILALGDIEWEQNRMEEEATAVILYTSGTTGKPKGAMLTHKNLFCNARDIRNYLKIRNDVVITTLPMFHVFSLTVALNAPLISGSTIIIIPKFSPSEIFRVARKYKATVFAGVPTMYNYLYQYPQGKRDDFASLRLCISGGSSMPVALLKNFEQKFQVTISEGYGLSEASPVTAFNPLDRPRKPGSIGTSIINVENKVVDENGNEVAVGEVGELIVRGPNVMKGYYKMPEETAKTIRNGWLYTGDLAKMDEDRYFYIVDRKKELIIVGGYNVYPREIEEVLYSHPEIVEAAVIGIPDPDLGEVVKAFVVRRNEQLEKDEIHAYLSQKLAPYKQPKEIEWIDQLPKNATGKISRIALKKQLLNS